MGFASANMTYARPFSFFADFLQKCSLRELKFSCFPLTRKCVLGTLAHSCRLFSVTTFIRCRNLREPLQDLRAREFQWLSDFFSPNIRVAKFRTNFVFVLVYYCFFHTKALFVCRQRQTRIYPIKRDRYN